MRRTLALALLFLSQLALPLWVYSQETGGEDRIALPDDREPSFKNPSSFLENVLGASTGQSTGEVEPVAPQPEPVGTPSAEPEGNAQVNEAIAYRTAANRARLPGDEINPPEGEAALLAELKSKFGVTPKNGSAKWDIPQLRALYRILSSLPESFRKCTKNVQREKSNGGILGWVMMGDPTVHVLSSAVSPGMFQGTIVHEMVHCWQAKNSALTKSFQKLFWPGNKMSGRSVSRYGCTQYVEDMAECGRAYWASGPLMKKYYPGRYEFMKKNVFGGVEFGAK